MSKTNANTKQSFDPAAAFPAFTMPNFDVDALVASQRRNVEALTEANKLATDGAQAFATRQAEILKSVVDTYADAMRGLMTANDPQTSVAKQAEFAKSTFETSPSSVAAKIGLGAKSRSMQRARCSRGVLSAVKDTWNELQGAWDKLIGELAPESPSNIIRLEKKSDELRSKLVRPEYPPLPDIPNALLAIKLGPDREALEAYEKDLREYQMHQAQNQREFYETQQELLILVARKTKSAKLGRDVAAELFPSSLNRE